MYKKIAVVLLATIALTVGAGTPMSAFQSNTLAGFVYNNPDCNGFVNPVVDQQVQIWSESGLVTTVQTVTGGLYGQDNLIAGIQYRAIFPRFGQDSIVEHFEFRDDITFFDIRVNLANCETMFLPNIIKWIFIYP